MPGERPPRRRRSHLQRRADAKAKSKRNAQKGGAEFIIIAIFTGIASGALWVKGNPEEGVLANFLGLAITQFVDGACHALFQGGDAAWARPAAFVFDGLAALTFFGIGAWALTGSKWAYRVGLTLYGLDTLVTIGVVFLAGPPALVLTACHAGFIAWMVASWRRSERALTVDALGEVFGGDPPDAAGGAAAPPEED